MNYVYEVYNTTEALLKLGWDKHDAGRMIFKHHKTSFVWGVRADLEK